MVLKSWGLGAVAGLGYRTLEIVVDTKGANVRLYEGNYYHYLMVQCILIVMQ